MEEVYKIVTTLDYRGVHLDLYLDEPGQQLFTILPWNMQEISFGSYNADYRADAEYLIDEHLDVISRDFGKAAWGACLRWFDNGGYRDIKLTYRQRVLKVYLVAIESEVDTEKLIADARKVLKKLVP